MNQISGAPSLLGAMIGSRAQASPTQGWPSGSVAPSSASMECDARGRGIDDQLLAHRWDLTPVHSETTCKTSEDGVTRRCGQKRLKAWTFCSGGSHAHHLSVTYVLYIPIRPSIFSTITHHLSLFGGAFGGVVTRYRKPVGTLVCRSTHYRSRFGMPAPMECNGVQREQTRRASDRNLVLIPAVASQPPDRRA
jgi:hypothetical protein